MKSIHLAAVFAVCLLPAVSQAQNSPQNLEYYPTNITRGEIIAEMRHFTFALGVRCEHCHERNANGRGFDFASDSNPNKEKARVMLFMTDAINSQFLPELADRDTPPVEVTCKTCHRGTQQPRLLWQEMVLTTHEEGAEAAIAQFSQLREDYDNAGAYDFREQEMNVVGEELAAEGHHGDAIIIFRMNADRFPESPRPWAGIGDSHEALGQIEEAVKAYEKAVEISPNRQFLARRLAELKGE